MKFLLCLFQRPLRDQLDFVVAIVSITVCNDSCQTVKSSPGYAIWPAEHEELARFRLHAIQPLCPLVIVQNVLFDVVSGDAWNFFLLLFVVVSQWPAFAFNADRLVSCQAIVMKINFDKNQNRIN